MVNPKIVLLNMLRTTFSALLTLGDKDKIKTMLDSKDIQDLFHPVQITCMRINLGPYGNPNDVITTIDDAIKIEKEKERRLTFLIGVYKKKEKEKEKDKDNPLSSFKNDITFDKNVIKVIFEYF
jgi:hypothetical protein